MHKPCHVSAFALCGLLLASLAQAQSAAGRASISGIVRDASGGVLPGVTVAASSPSLIEKTREQVSDDAGRYRIIDLPAGTYTLTLTLQGFTTVRRDAIQLEGNFAASINVELTVGQLSEVVTVTGSTPIVNIQSAYAKALLVDRDALRAAQAAGDVLGAHRVLTAAYETDVRPVLVASREASGLPFDPVETFRREGHAERLTHERA